MTFEGKVILVTGGTGSLGQAFVLEALKYDFKSIRIYSRGEYAQWIMQHRDDFQDDRLRFVIGDIRDKDRLTRAMHDVDYIIHTAALKHVSFCQLNPVEVFKTNILGSMNVVDACLDTHVEKAIGISSDKAIQPTSLYGTTKQGMEELFENANIYGGTKFSCLRSGNFFESRGNVFELWDKRAEGGELTLTSEGMVRYFIPVADVAKLLITVLGIMKGQEIFIPKMKEYSMIDLLRQRYPNCKIKMVGKGKGEKIREVLFSEDEILQDCGDYYMIGG